MNNTGASHNEDDKSLVSRVLDGDHRAFTAIIKKTEGLVTQIIFKMIGRMEDRQDMAQDIYLKVYKALPGFKFQAKLSTWIAQVAYNTCYDHLRRKKEVFDEDVLFTREAVQGNADEIIHSIHKKELGHLLGYAISRLAPIYQTLIVLYHQEDLSYLEIAQITGLPEGTVKSYLFRARKALRTNLSGAVKKEDI